MRSRKMCSCLNFFHSLFSNNNHAENSYASTARQSPLLVEESKEDSKDDFPPLQRITILHTSSDIFHTPRAYFWIPTFHETELLNETWSNDPEFLFSIGSQIYDYIFDHNPNTRKLFPTIHQHGEKWRESEEFRNMALRFTQTISMCISLLDNLPRAREILRDIGEKHVQYAQRGFKPVYWDIFHDALITSITDYLSSHENFTKQKFEDAKNAWSKLAYFIIRHMKRGYIRKLVQEFQAQSQSFGAWSKKHPSFKTSVAKLKRHSLKEKVQNLIK